MAKEKDFFQKYGVFLLAALVIVVVLTVPNLTSPYQLNVFNITLIYSIGCLGISVMMGMGGYMQLMSIAFMGIGGFMSANLSMKAGFPVWLSILTSSASMGLLCFILGQALLNLSGSFFAFSGIGIVQVTFVFMQNFKPFSGGPDGMTHIPRLKLFGILFDDYNKWFYVLIVLMIIVGMVVEQIRRTSFGRALQSIRDDRIAAQTLGIDIKNTSIYAYSLSGMLAGLSGGLIVHHNTSASATLFTQATSNRWFLMAMIGGVNSTLGTLFGVFFMNFLPEVLRVSGRFMKLLDGILIIVLMIFMPMGVAGLVKTIYTRIKLAGKKRKEAVA